MQVQLQFEYGQQDKLSPVYGPYDYIQITYEAIRVGPEGERELAYYHFGDQIWITDNGERWSDVIITAV